jgi:hypothetical protein
MMSTLFGPYGLALLFPLFAIAAVARTWWEYRGRLTLAASVLVALLALAGTCWSLARAMLPTEPVVSAEMLAGQTPLQVPASDTRLCLLVRGEMPELEHGAQEATVWTLVFRTGGDEVSRYQGNFSEKRVSRSLGRGVHLGSVESRLEERVEIPAALSGRAFELAFAEASGPLQGALEVDVVPAPPPSWLLLGAGGLLAAAGACIDAREGRKGLLSFIFSVLAFYVLFMTHGATPHASSGFVVPALLFSLMGGVLAGWIVMKLIRRLVPRRVPAT